MIADEEFLSVSKEREAIYSFLRVAFENFLSIEALEHWKEELPTEFIAILTEDNEGLKTFFKRLKEEDLSVIAQEEKDSYLATFNIFNDNGKIPAPPWESAYVTIDQTLFGEPVFEIRKKLAQFNLQFVKENTEPDDHISIELEFMCYLINYTCESLQSGSEAPFEKGVYTKYWLIKEHLNKWIKPFAQDILSSASTPFYKGIAKLLYQFIAEDFEYIKLLKEGLENG